MKKGEVKEFTGTYPAEAVNEGENKEQAEPAQPRESKFQVEVKECHRKVYPTDEEFLKNLSKSTIDELKDDVRSRLLEVRKETAKRQHSDKVEDALLAKATVEIPKVMIDRKQEELFDRFAQRLQDAGANVEQYLRSTGRAPEDIVKDFAAQAEKEVKRDLVLDAVGVKEEIKVSDEAVNNVVEALARETGKDAAAVRTTLEVRGALADIERNLLRVETLKKMAVVAAAKAGTPLPEDAPAQEKPAEPETK
jgi:trigger factor